MRGMDEEGQHEEGSELLLAGSTASVASRDDAAARSQHRLPNPAGQKCLSGWRVGALIGLCLATCICILNFSLTIWVWSKTNRKIEGMIGTLFEGNCETARRRSVWIHLFVNSMGTLLLAASNYCMQVLSAPDRAELTCAHERLKWLQIDIPTLHNFPYIAVDRTVLWVLLFLSSVPLHLLYNSVVFTNLQANRWLDGDPFDTSGFVDLDAQTTAKIVSEIDEYRPVAGVKDWRRVSTADCFDMYSAQYVTDVGNVLLIQDGPTIWRNLTKWFPALDGDDGRPR